jgi:hypothetical protein
MKVQGVGLPFNVSHSSCSNLKPTHFEWSDDKQDIQVAVDNAIVNVLPHLTQYPTNSRYGWICESRAIVPQLVDILKTHTEDIVQHYDAIFTCDKELTELHDKFKFCPNGSNLAWVPKEHQQIYSKSKVCSMVASPKQMCEGHVYRHQWADRLKDKIDLFGGACGSERIGFSPEHTHPDKRAALVDYMFSVTMENDRYETYFTEKVTDCFVTGTVPIYWGAPDIDKHFDPEGIIFLDDDFDVDTLNKDKYDSMKDAIAENYKIATSLEMAEDYMFNNYFQPTKKATTI